MSTARETRGKTAGLSLSQIYSVRPLGGTVAPEWTPDGSAITFVSTIGGSADAWNINPDTGRLTRLSAGLGPLTYAGIGYSIRWSPTGEYLSYICAKSGNDEIWLLPQDGSPAFQLTALAGRIEAYNWAPDGKSIALASNTHGAFDIFRVGVPDREHTKLTDHYLYEVYPSFTPDGRLLYVRLNDAWTDHDVILMNGDGSDPRVVLEDRDFFDYHYGRDFSYPNVSPDGKTFLFQSMRSGWLNTWIAPVDGSSEPRQIAAAEADQTDAAWSPDGRSIAYVENHNGTLEIRIVGADSGEPRRLVAPGMGVCTSPAWSPDGKRLAYLMQTPSSPNDLWVVDVESGERRQLTRSMLGLNGNLEERVIRPEKVSYTSFDGMTINAYLYRPPTPEGKKYPGIVWVHGGPTGQYIDTWQPQIQFFANQGYVVIMPNIRGSTGYGQPFEAANDRDWGGGDLKDCIEAGNYLRFLPEVDEQHIGITGTSYGGTMSMYATVYSPPGAFQASIPCSGYCDYTRGFDERELRSQKMYEYELGERTFENWKRFDSIRFVQQANMPCFVIHGEGKYPGSIHSREFALALEANYKPVWYKAYKGENYYVTGAKVPEMLRDMMAFFDIHLKGLPHNLPDDGTRPLTHLSGVVFPTPVGGGGGGAQPAVSIASHIPAGEPPKDVAN